MKFMLDANVNHAVGDILMGRGHNVDLVNNSFLPGTPDPDIDAVARVEGWVIVSYDQRFLRRIQQPRFGFSDPAGSGYGRVMLMIPLALQVRRMEQCMDVVEQLHSLAVVSGRRLLVTVGENFVRYDDEPLRRTQRRSKPQHG